MIAYIDGCSRNSSKVAKQHVASVAIQSVMSNKFYLLRAP